MLLCKKAISVLLLFSLTGFAEESSPEAHSIYQSQPAPAFSIGEAVDFVCHEAQGEGNMGPRDTQVHIRLHVLQTYRGYRFQPEHAPQWRRLLRDSSASIYGRMCAARFLLEIDEQQARTFIDEQLASPDRRRSYNTVYALLDYLRDDASKTWAVQKIIQLIRDERFTCTVVNGESHCGEYVMNHLAGDYEDFPEGDYQDGLCEPLDDLCLAAGWTRSKTAVPALIAVLERYPERHGAALALGEIGDLQAGPVLLKIFNESEQPHEFVVHAIGKIKYVPAVPALIDRLRKAQASSHVYDWPDCLIEALGHIGDERAVPALRAELPRLEASAKAAIRRALAHLENKDPVPALLKLIETEPDAHDVNEIVRDLAEFKDGRTIQPLVQVARSSRPPSTRYQAILTLGAFRTHEALLALVGLLTAHFPIPDAPDWKLSPEDVSGFMRERIAEQLREATKQSFGQNATAWRHWLETNPSTRPESSSQ